MPPSLSKIWKVVKTHEQSYTGGKVLSSHDGKFFACMCGESVALLSLDSGTVTRTIKADEDDPFTSFALHPKGTRLITASSRSQLLRLWDLENGNCIKSWRGHEQPVTDMNYDTTGTYLATASADRTVRVWNAEEGYVTHSFKGHNSMAMRVIFHPIPERMEVVSCAFDGEIRVWNLLTRKSRSLSNHMSAAMGLAFSHDGSLMLSAGRDKIISLWNLNKFTLVSSRPLFQELEAAVTLPKNWLPPSGTTSTAGYAAVGGEKGDVLVFDLKDLKQHSSIPNPSLKTLGEKDEEQDAKDKEEKKESETDQTAIVHLLSFCTAPPTPASEDEKDSKVEKDAKVEKVQPSPPALQHSLAVITQENIFYLYDAITFQQKKLLLGFNDEIADARCHPDNKRVFVATNSTQVSIMNLETLEAQIFDAHRDTVLALDISSDGKWLVTSSRDRAVRVWQLDPIRCLKICVGHAEAVSVVRFSKKTGREMFAVSGSRDRILKLWSCQDLSECALKQGPAATMNAVVSQVAHQRDINAIAVSPNDKLVATGSQDKTIKLWSITINSGTSTSTPTDSVTYDMRLLATLKGHKRGIMSVEFSTVDQVLVSGSADKTIKIWSMADFTCLKTLEGHSHSVLKVSFLNRGMQLMSAGSDGVVKLWMIRTSECINTFAEQHNDKVWALAITPDEKTMVTGGTDSRLLVWQDATQTVLDEEDAARRDAIKKEQKLNTYLRKQDYVQAVGLALELEQPRRLLNIFTDITSPYAKPVAKHVKDVPISLRGSGKRKKEAMSDGILPDPSDIERTLNEVITSLDENQLGTLFKFLREWNTNAKTSLISQHLLRVILTLPLSMLEKIPGIKDITESLLIYNERHFSRIDRLLQQSFLLDYTFRRCQLLESAS